MREEARAGAHTQTQANTKKKPNQSHYNNNESLTTRQPSAWHGACVQQPGRPPPTPAAELGPRCWRAACARWPAARRACAGSKQGVQAWVCFPIHDEKEGRARMVHASNGQLLGAPVRVQSEECRRGCVLQFTRSTMGREVEQRWYKGVQTHFLDFLCKWNGFLKAQS